MAWRVSVDRWSMTTALKRFFPGDVRLGLELIAERQLSNGAIILRYTVRS